MLVPTRELAVQVNEVFHQDQFALLNIDANESDTATMSEATGIAYNSSKYPIDQQLSKKALAMTDWDGSSWGTHSHHTTHFTTADCSGAVVSITQTNGPNYGSKVMTPFSLSKYFILLKYILNHNIK